MKSHNDDVIVVLNYGKGAQAAAWSRSLNLGHCTWLKVEDWQTVWKYCVLNPILNFTVDNSQTVRIETARNIPVMQEPVSGGMTGYDPAQGDEKEYQSQQLSALGSVPSVYAQKEPPAEAEGEVPPVQGA